MSSIIKLTDRFTETQLDDEAVVMRLDNGEFFVFSGTALAAWRLIDGTRDQEQVVAHLADEFEGDPAAIRSDVDELVTQLTGMGLVAKR